ncbi:MAG: NAD-binding protein, partial [Granulosicoccus sp.]|nr:NAD-binding protein [Granulosicoccus sp.]
LSEILDSLESPTTLIDCSTIDVEDARKAHKLCKEAGHSFLDAPVSGGVAGAEAGSLTAMIGGDRSVIDRCSTVLEVLFDNVIFCGDAGNGQAAKLCNNMLLAVSMIGVSESFILGEKLGLSASTLFDVLSTSTGSCWSVNRYCPVADVGPKSPADNDFKPGFSAKMMLKDMNLAQKAASESDTATPLGTHAQSLYQDYVNQQGGAEDFSGISRFLRSGIRNDSQN